MLPALEAIDFPDLRSVTISPTALNTGEIHRTLSSGAWNLLMLMSSHAQGGDDPPIELLVAEHGGTARTLRRHAVVLIEHGWLVVDQSTRCGYAMGPEWNRIMVPILLALVREAGSL